jgi:hypothetical protein
MYPDMFSITRRLGRALPALLVGFALAGCDAGVEPGVGRLDVVLSQSSSELAASVVGSEMAALAGVPLESVQSISITVDRIEVHRVGSDDDDESESEGSEGEGSEGEGSEGADGDGTEDDEGSGAWISVDLASGGVAAGGVTVDLVGMSPQEIASDAVPGGTYNKLRLFFDPSTATITFSEEVTVDGGSTCDAGTHVLDIPSSANTGIKVQTGFFDVSNGETETVEVVVDLANSVKNVTCNQNGVKMTPVIDGKVGSTQT